MSTSPARGGSGVSARTVTPSLNLAELDIQLGKALSPTSSTGQAALPLLSIEGARVTVKTRGVLHRLFKDDAFSKAFTPVEGAGLVRNTAVPPRGTIARIGGRLLAGTEGTTAKALDNQHDEASALADSALANIDAASSVCSFRLQGSGVSSTRRADQFFKPLVHRHSLLPSSSSFTFASRRVFSKLSSFDAMKYRSSNTVSSLRGLTSPTEVAQGNDA